MYSVNIGLLNFTVE